LAKNRLSDNVGGVKHFSSTLQYALGEDGTIFNAPLRIKPENAA